MSLCIGGCNWSTASYWAPSGYPDAGDDATIAQNTTVRLTENIGALDGLTLSDGVRLTTSGFALNASASQANTNIVGNGSTGATTRLTVSSGAPLGFDFLAYFASIRQGAELRMNGGGAAATFGFNFSSSSLISGDGTVVLLGTGNAFDVNGTVRPSDGLLILWSQAPNALDLDGNVGGVEGGILDVTSNGDLEIRGSLADPFSSTLTISARNDVEFDSDIGIDGLVRFAATTESHLIAPSIGFDPGAQFEVDGAIAYLDAVTNWPLLTSLDLVAATDELHLTENSHFGVSTTWSGDGLLVNESGAGMSLAFGSDVGVRVRNEGNLVIANSVTDSTGFIAVDDFEQATTGTLLFDIEGTAPGVTYDQIQVKGDLTLGGDFQLLSSAGFTISQGDAFHIMTVNGTSTGSFSGLAEGDPIGNFGGEDLYVTYTGGDGNDVVLYTLPEPGFAMGLGIGVWTLVALRRSGNLGENLVESREDVYA